MKVGCDNDDDNDKLHLFIKSSSAAGDGVTSPPSTRGDGRKGIVIIEWVGRNKNRFHQ